jgi:hypothetical protein
MEMGPFGLQDAMGFVAAAPRHRGVPSIWGDPIRPAIAGWDRMILFSALPVGCQVACSEDLNPGQVSDQLSVPNPF